VITKRHRQGDMRSTAQYSACGLYRYALTRVWTPEAPRLTYIMLNPSTATERANDPTVERCERRARAMGYGAMRVVNLFGFRATHPADLRRAPEPIGPGNDRAIDRAAAWAGCVICAWGVHGAHLGRGPQIVARLQGLGHRLHHLGLTKAGHPRHPLYLPYSAGPMPWPEPGV
jgi:hypothetical protein